jgi:hypothetical protein
VVQAGFARIGLWLALGLGAVQGLSAQQPEASPQPNLSLSSSQTAFSSPQTAFSQETGSPEINNVPAESEQLAESSVPAEALVAPDAATNQAATNQAPAFLSADFAPLNLKQKYLYSINEIFGISPLLAIAAHAALDQAGVAPVQWGKNADSLAIRVASHFGDALLRHNLEFGVRALDHEDPRYFRMGHGNPWSRAKYAVLHTFAVRSDSGRTMPAYSLFVTDFGMPFVVREWHPGRQYALNQVEAGTLAVGVGMGSNLFNEFWPDLKKLLPGRLSQGPLSRLVGSPKY